MCKGTARRNAGGGARAREKGRGSEKREEEVEERNETGDGGCRSNDADIFFRPCARFSASLVVRLSRSLSESKLLLLMRHLRSERSFNRKRACGERREPFSSIAFAVAASKKKKLTLLRLDGSLDGGDGGVGAELERERAVCESEWGVCLGKRGRERWSAEKGAREKRDPEQRANQPPSSIAPLPRRGGFLPFAALIRITGRTSANKDLHRECFCIRRT